MANRSDTGSGTAAVSLAIDRRSDGVWIVTLNKPPANAVDLGVVADFGRAFTEIVEEPACKAVVLTGAGAIFCAGLDTKVVPAYSSEQQAELLRRINRMILQAYGLPKPLVAAINGHAVGAGMVLALVADRRVAAAGSYKLGLTEVAAGIPFPAGPMAVVQAELSPPVVRRLTLTGVTHGPHEFAVSELVDVLVEPDRLIEASMAAAAALAAAPAYAAVKRQTRGPAIERLTAVVERGEDPLAKGWLS